MSLDTGGGTDVLPDWAADDGIEDQQQQQQQQQQQPKMSGASAAPPSSHIPAATSTVDTPGIDNVATSTTATTTSHPERKFDWHATIKRDGRLLLITAIIIIVMNIPYLKYVLYPLSLFATWVHELCHGIAAIFVGGRVQKLLLFPDTSGLAYTSLPAGDGRRAFVAQAGYTGTAVVGCLLLIFRRTKRGPRSGTMVLAVVMLLSCAIWIRNAFGFCMIALIGIALGLCAWKLPSARIRDVYTCVAVTTALNAITNVHDLFGANQMVNGQPSSTDAHTMADVAGGPFWFWAVLWLFVALIMAGVGLVFAVPGPDEAADFKCCGVCIDLGVFDVCNKRRRRTEDTTSSSVG